MNLKRLIVAMLLFVFTTQVNAQDKVVTGKVTDAAGAAVAIPTLPALVTRAFSVLLVLITKSMASVVPMKLVPAVVPASPVVDHTPLIAEAELSSNTHEAPFQ